MTNKHTTKYNQPIESSTARSERPRFSPATMEIARKSLNEFEAQSERDFLDRAKMNRDLRSL